MNEPGPAGLFRSDFLDKGLVTFAECIGHYQAFGSDALLEEMRRLLTAPMLAIPFDVSSARYFALMAALVRCAGTDRELSDAQRAKLVKLCVDVGTFLRGRAADNRMECFDIMLGSSLEAVRGSAFFPAIADQIETHLVATVPSGPAQEPQQEASEGPSIVQVLDFRQPPAPLPLAATA